MQCLWPLLQIARGKKIFHMLVQAWLYRWRCQPCTRDVIIQCSSKLALIEWPSRSRSLKSCAREGMPNSHSTLKASNFKMLCSMCGFYLDLFCSRLEGSPRLLFVCLHLTEFSIIISNLRTVREGEKKCQIF